MSERTRTLKKGWAAVSASTEIHIDDEGRPSKVRTTRYNLDAALDDAAEYNGVPLERTSAWLTNDGRDPEKVDAGNNTLVTCNVREQETL